VFAGGCTLDAAETVCAGNPIEDDEVLELLSGLVARSLVVADDAEPDTRYRLLETIRQYSEERLAETGETDTLQVRHAGFYADFAAEVTTHIYGPGQVEWGARLARERDNLHAALTYALDIQDVDLAFGLFCPLLPQPAQINEWVIPDPTRLLELPGADDHPGSAVALLEAGWRAWRCDGDPHQALSLCDQALAAEQRFGPVPGGFVEIWSHLLRGEIAQAGGASQEAAKHILDGARRARAAELPATAAILLANAAYILAWSDPVAAQRHARDGLTLARQTGMPSAIADNLQGLALALATTDPDQARARLVEALQLTTTLCYESPSGLSSVVFAAARLQDWSSLLRAASRVMHHQTRTDTQGFVYVAATLNLVARALAQPQPEPAAVLQGTVTGMLRRLTPDVAAPVSEGAPDHDNAAAFVTQIRRDTTQLLTVALGETRVRELRAQGAAMDETQACTYARTHIDEYLAHAARAES
jgi:MalT-like TPR region